MAPTIEKPAGGESPIAAPLPKFDAKRYLEQNLSKEPGDTLRVYAMPQGSAFRVNWYCALERRAAEIPGLNPLHVRQSRFLYCRLDAQGNPEITYPAKQ